MDDKCGTDSRVLYDKNTENGFQRNKYSIFSIKGHKFYPIFRVNLVGASKS